MFDYCKKNGIPYAHVIANTWRFIYMDTPETQQKRIERLAERLQEMANKVYQLETRLKKHENP